MDKKPPLRIALAGLGNVGAATYAVLARNADVIAQRCGRRLEVVAVAVRDLDKAKAVVGSQVDLTQDALSLVQRDDIDVVCELIGGSEIAKDLVLQALAKKMPVVTANKALLASFGDEVFLAAKQHGVYLGFEAAVAGGIPIIKALREGLAANQIKSLMGIINGTCNFILTAMTEKGASFDEVLAKAQQLGYAEQDPSADVDGYDTAHKLALLAAIAFGIAPRFDDAYIEGIRQVDALDIAYARDLGYTIKLLAIGRRCADGVELRVHPTLVPIKSTIANVFGVLNAVLVDGNAVGPTMYSGAGAGGEATASAVIADLIDFCRSRDGEPVPPLGYAQAASSPPPIVPMAKVRCCHYLRMRVNDETGVLADITRVLADRNISIDAMRQPEAGDGQTDIVLITHEASEAAVDDAITALSKLSKILKPVKKLRLEHLQP